jgi:hypothetical protein
MVRSLYRLRCEVARVNPLRRRPTDAGQFDRASRRAIGFPKPIRACRVESREQNGLSDHLGIPVIPELLSMDPEWRSSLETGNLEAGFTTNINHLPGVDPCDFLSK